MSQRRSKQFWLSIDESIPNPFQNINDRSRTANQIRDDSMSLFPKCEDPKITLNFDQNQTDKETAKKKFNFLDVINQQSQNQKIEDQSQQLSIDRMHLQRKGLKYLAGLAYETLKKKKLKSHIEVVSALENYVRETKNENQGIISNYYVIQKEGKNIKRRLYDALNVMSAAEVIEKTQDCIEICDSHEHTSKYNLRLKKDYLAKDIDNLQSRIHQKRREVQRLKKIKHSLDQLICRNQFSRKIQNHNKIRFPIILVKSQDKQIIDVEIDNLRQVIKVQCSKQTEIMAELDLLPAVFFKNPQIKNQDDFKGQ